MGRVESVFDTFSQQSYEIRHSLRDFFLFKIVQEIGFCAPFFGHITIEKLLKTMSITTLYFGSELSHIKFTDKVLPHVYPSLIMEEWCASTPNLASCNLATPGKRLGFTTRAPTPRKIALLCNRWW